MPFSPNCFSTGRAGLSLGNSADVNQQRDFRDLRLSNIPPFDAPIEQSGRASGTYLFNAGQSAPLSMFTVITATVPDMLWPTLAGIIGLIAIFEGKRWREVLQFTTPFSWRFP